jgi:hypothetical protein
MLILPQKWDFILIAFYNAYGKNKRNKNMPMDRKKKKRFNGFSIFCVISSILRLAKRSKDF